MSFPLTEALLFAATAGFAPEQVNDELAIGTPRPLATDYFRCVNEGLEALIANQDFAKLPTVMKGEGASIKITSSQIRTITIKVSFRKSPIDFGLEADFLFSCETRKFTGFVPYR